MSNSVSGNLYTTFSGESDTPIQNVYSISPDGNVQTDILQGVTFDELRGLAFAPSPDGRLFVANAHKTSSAIYVFPKDPNPDGTRDWPGFAITPVGTAGLWHPYELALAREGGQLLASSQDTNVVTGWVTPPTFSEPRTTPISSYLSGQYGDHFFPGTAVASATPLENDGFTPTAVPADCGGLHYDDSSGSAHSVRGIAVSADGKLLFVADEAGDRVTVYEMETGAYLSSITESKNHSIQKPVGVALNPADGNIYIGSTGNNRIFCYDIASRDTTVFIHDSDKLDKVSGLAFNTAGDLFTGSRSTAKIYRAAAGSTDLQTLAGPFGDSPECLVVVP